MKSEERAQSLEKDIKKERQTSQKREKDLEFKIKAAEK